MAKQRQHIRLYKSGRRAIVNPGLNKAPYSSTVRYRHHTLGIRQVASKKFMVFVRKPGDPITDNDTFRSKTEALVMVKRLKRTIKTFDRRKKEMDRKIRELEKSIHRREAKEKIKTDDIQVKG